ncbi:ribonuclease H-like domain-containing protein, partial [Tanacetum coccineum]
MSFLQTLNFLTPQQNGVAERRNRTLIEAARTMLADSKLPTTFWAEAVSTACYVQNRVLVVKPQNKTPYELFRDSLGKFDGKSDEGFYIGYSLSSKAFRVYNTRTKKVQSLMNLQVHKENLIQVHQKKSVKIALRCQFGKMIHILIHSPSKDVDISKPKSVVDDQKQVQDGLDNENDEKDKSDDDSSPKEVNAAGQHVNTASPDVNIGSFKLNVVDPLVNTASSYDQDNPK